MGKKLEDDIDDFIAKYSLPSQAKEDFEDVLDRVLKWQYGVTLSEFQDWEKLEEKAFLDDMTGLYNRHFFMEELNRLLTNRNLPLSVIIADVNGLKIINDAFGHERGNEVIFNIGDAINKVSRSEDIVSRWGGDEYGVILPQTPENVARSMAERIKEENYYVNSSHLIPHCISVGYTTKYSIENPEKFIEEADHMMYDKDKLSSSRGQEVLRHLYDELMRRDKCMEEHCRKVSEKSLRIADMIGVSESEKERLEKLCWYHDIGEVVRFSKEDGRICSSCEERESYISHPSNGYLITKSSPKTSDIALEVLYHHENWDGTGFPFGMKSEDVPLLSRIVHMSEDFARYSENSSKSLRDYFKSNSGVKFDPKLVEKVYG